MKLGVEVREDVLTQVLYDYKKGKINKSECIRQCFRGGMEVKEISQKMGIIYNMVYNIVSKMILREDLESLVIKEVKVSFETELLAYVKDNPGVKKSEVVKYFIKQGRGEGYIYGNLKKIIEEGKVKF